MFSTAVLVLLVANAGDLAFNPIEMSVVATTDADGRWCAEPAFEATIKNSSTATVWLDLGGRDRALVVTSYSVAYRTKRGGSSQGSATGRSDD
jgi:hypothetical protein